MELADWDHEPAQQIRWRSGDLETSGFVLANVRRPPHVKVVEHVHGRLDSRLFRSPDRCRLAAAMRRASAAHFALDQMAGPDERVHRRSDPGECTHLPPSAPLCARLRYRHRREASPPTKY